MLTFDWLYLIGLAYLCLIGAIAFLGVHIGELEAENRVLRDELAAHSPEYAEAMEAECQP